MPEWKVNAPLYSCENRSNWHDLCSSPCYAIITILFSIDCYYYYIVFLISRRHSIILVIFWSGTLQIRPVSVRAPYTHISICRFVASKLERMQDVVNWNKCKLRCSSECIHLQAYNSFRCTSKRYTLKQLCPKSTSSDCMCVWRDGGTCPLAGCIIQLWHESKSWFA